MSRILAIANQKGGVGKTTTAINLAAALSLEGLACLLIDSDPQANATAGYGFGKNDERVSTYDVLVSGASLDDAALPTEIEGLQLVPSSKHLVGATVELIEQEERAFKLKRALDPVKSRYDFILVDCPPALDLLTLNALVAADALVVPMQAEYFALEGISELMHTLQRVQEAFNRHLTVEGILLTMFDERTNLSQQVSSDLRSHFGDKVFTTTIPRNVRLAEAPSYGRPVALYDARSRGAEAYRELALEVLARNQMVSRRRVQASGSAPATVESAALKSVRLWPYA